MERRLHAPILPLARRVQVGDGAPGRLERAAGKVVARQPALPVDSPAQQLVLSQLRRRSGLPGEVRDADRADAVEREVLSQAFLERAVPRRVRDVDAFLAVPERVDALGVRDFPDTLGGEAPP